MLDNVTKADDREGIRQTRVCTRRETLNRAPFHDLKTGIVLSFVIMLFVVFFFNSRTEMSKKGKPPRWSWRKKLSTFPRGLYAYNRRLSRQSSLSIGGEKNAIKISRLHHYKKSDVAPELPDYWLVSTSSGSNIGYKRRILCFKYKMIAIR